MRRPLLIYFPGDTQPPCPDGVPEGVEGAEWNLGPSEGVEANAIPDNVRGLVRLLAMDCPSAVAAESARVVTGALELAATLQVQALNVSIPPVAAGEGTRFDRYLDALNFTHTLLRETRLEAESRGVTLAIVAPSRGALCSPVELRELLDAAHSSTIGACVDVEAAMRFGSIEDWLTTLGRRVRSIRISPQVECDVHGLRRGLQWVPHDRPLIVAGPGQLDAYAALCDVARPAPTE